MNGPRTIVFLHGAGGTIQPGSWLEPLNERLASMRHSPFDPEFDEVIAPGYLTALTSGASVTEPTITWKRGSDRDYRTAKLRYLEQLDDLSRTARAWERFRSGPDASWLPDALADDSPLTRFGVNFLEPVRRYQNHRESRWAAQRKVLGQLPTSGSIILVAHSLGSVLAVDLLTKLPAGLHVDLLLTIGSPLAIKRIGHPARDFPYDRVGAWVNVYDSGDLVTIGRGVSRRFPAACDIGVQTGESHDAVAYLSNPAVAAVIGHVAYGKATSPQQPGVQRLLHPSWHPLLLSFAYSTQLSAGAKGQDWLFKARIDAARRILAQRTVADVQQKRRELLEQEAPSIDASPVGDGRFPSEADLLRYAADLIRDTWTDEALLALAVGLAMSPPLPPFDVHVSDEQRHEALLNTLNRVRRRQGNLSDKDFAQAVRDGVKAGKSAMRETSFPWGTVLVGTGLVLLSLTGVGLLVSAPAGLAGAALVTGTLAAFGPGGMVGGLLTIATLTGAGAAAAGMGVGVGAADDPMVIERARRVAAEELASMSAGPLRNSLAGVLAVVDAQRRLQLASTADVVEELLTSTLDAVRRELTLHEEVAPDRAGTKELQHRADILQKAIDWLISTQLRDDSWQKTKDRLADLPESLGDGPMPRRTRDTDRRALEPPP